MLFLSFHDNNSACFYFNSLFVFSGDLDIIQNLIEQGANVNAENEDKVSVLRFAVDSRNSILINKNCYF